LNHIHIKGFNKVLETVKQNSLESFKIGQIHSLAHFVPLNGPNYGFGGVTEYEGRFENFKAMIKDNLIVNLMQ